MKSKKGSQDFLIDVRTPAEFSTGSLSNDIHPLATNIEYQSIASLTSILTEVSKQDKITLYCRSGRRSNIAMQALQRLGYTNVRDIGGFEEAKAVLRREEVERRHQADREFEESTVAEDTGKAEERRKAFGALLLGLKGCE
ncbi:hypothetical protein GRF29_8g1890991 [Pseudopithomyces chartarum]|uniref:Rhodanese domain-containing protein n=1 Tax=Pseudopithomyces chartarum TaxID=1892770 RepID=A0AAN6M582_9PLEO|nr:hypothetical protein GRF29_8g1890991 [Pseudopithomyces chartarum]